MSKKWFQALAVGSALATYGAAMYIMGIITGMYIQEAKDLSKEIDRLENDDEKLDRLVRLAG